MPLKLKRFSEGRWFKYLDDSRFKIRATQPKQYLEFREKTKTKVRVENSDGTSSFIDDYNEALLYWKVFEYVLEDWEKIEVEGATTREEIKEAIFNNKDARDFISTKSNEMFSEINSNLEGELKNSESSQSG